MIYKEELIRTMNWLGSLPNTIFLGQGVQFNGHSIYETLILKITNEEDGKGTGNEKEERKDTGETPGN